MARFLEQRGKLDHTRLWATKPLYPGYYCLVMWFVETAVRDRKVNS